MLGRARPRPGTRPLRRVSRQRAWPTMRCARPTASSTPSTRAARSSSTTSNEDPYQLDERGRRPRIRGHRRAAGGAARRAARLRGRGLPLGAAALAVRHSSRRRARRRPGRRPARPDLVERGDHRRPLRALRDDPDHPRARGRAAGGDVARRRASCPICLEGDRLQRDGRASDDEQLLPAERRICVARPYPLLAADRHPPDPGVGGRAHRRPRHQGRSATRRDRDCDQDARAPRAPLRVRLHGSNIRDRRPGLAAVPARECRVNLVADPTIATLAPATSSCSASIGTDGRHRRGPRPPERRAASRRARSTPASSGTSAGPSSGAVDPGERSAVDPLAAAAESPAGPAALTFARGRSWTSATCSYSAFVGSQLVLGQSPAPCSTTSFTAAVGQLDGRRKRGATASTARSGPRRAPFEGRHARGHARTPRAAAIRCRST